MQASHPEREGELARAHALILQGMVTPSADDPATAHVLSSDGAKRYTVNGQCDCRAGQHDKPCKHMQAWKLYQYIAKKVEAQPTPPGHEAPASCNVSVMIRGHKVQITLRDADEQRMLERLQTLLAQYPAPEAPAQSQPTQVQSDTPQCPTHGAMRKSTKGKGWYCAHKLEDDETWCPSKSR